MFVHAHPDDESLWTGGTIAALARDGGDPILVTCTWEPGTARARELGDAARELGMRTPPILLGFADTFVPDSAPGAAAFTQAPFDDQTALLTGHIRRLRPDVLVTYDAFGIYGHPDHIHANRLVCAAADAAATAPYRPDLGPAWQTRSLYFVTLADTAIQTLRPLLGEHSHFPAQGAPAEHIDLTVDVRSQLGDKIRAIYSHVTELSRSESMRAFASLPPEPQRDFLGWENYRRRDLVTPGAQLTPGGEPGR